MNFRVGFGYDVHPLVEGRKFVLGAVEIDHHKGAQGHSDADVLVHALCDALLGAAALGDIGIHFPPTDESYRNIDGTILLSHVVQLLRAKCYTIGNVDTTIVLQLPKVSTYIPLMKEKLANLLGVAETSVSIKVTTTEHLGFVGREEGVSAYAIALISQEEVER